IVWFANGLSGEGSNGVCRRAITLISIHLIHAPLKPVSPPWQIVFHEKASQMKDASVYPLQTFLRRMRLSLNLLGTEQSQRMKVRTKFFS
ncbi:MAG TPA: hypothetical protein DHV39_15225, partial [Verrucomicrobiales bacterium]|nr:hypothetical protein [Verrucomicrobiales bacterium]